MKMTARQMVAPGRSWWLAGLYAHKGHPFIADCGHRHKTRAEALRCGEQLERNMYDAKLSQSTIAGMQR